MASAIVLIGTRKGLAIARSDGARRHWDVGPMQFSNLEVSAVAIDARRTPPRLLVGAGTGHWGLVLATSDDLGRSWTETEQAAIAFPADTETALMRIWQLQPAADNQPDVVYAGVEPHALFRSEDGGRSFSLVRGLWEHPHRTTWTPGGGGACLHTVLTHPTDPSWLLVAMSAAGVYVSNDAGASWRPGNRGIQAHWLPEDQRFPEFGQCVHKVAMHGANPQRLFAQNHFGVYRSDDGAQTWTAIEDGLPSNFGFPMVVHPQRGEVAFTFPLRADMERFPPDALCRVYRTEDAGTSWHSSSSGLPEEPYYAAVMRDAMTADNGDPAGVYVGTRAGDVFASADEGESWTTLLSHHPDVLSVRAAVLA